VWEREREIERECVYERERQSVCFDERERQCVREIVCVRQRESRMKKETWERGRASELVLLIVCEREI
jgi:hypothetical protein